MDQKITANVAVTKLYKRTQVREAFTNKKFKYLYKSVFIIKSMVSSTAAHPNAWLGCPQYREDSDVVMVHGYNVDVGRLVSVVELQF